MDTTFAASKYTVLTLQTFFVSASFISLANLFGTLWIDVLSFSLTATWNVIQTLQVSTRMLNIPTIIVEAWFTIE